MPPTSRRYPELTKHSVNVTKLTSKAFSRLSRSDEEIRTNGRLRTAAMPQKTISGLTQHLSSHKCRIAGHEFRCAKLGLCWQSGNRTPSLVISHI